MELSVKGLIQSMQVQDSNILIGIVKKTSPVEITAINDDKFVIYSSMVTVPEHLKDHSVNVTLPIADTNGKNSGSMMMSSGLKAGDAVVLLGYNECRNYIVIGKLV